MDPGRLLVPAIYSISSVTTHDNQNHVLGAMLSPLRSCFARHWRLVLISCRVCRELHRMIGCRTNGSMRFAQVYRTTSPTLEHSHLQ